MEANFRYKGSRLWCKWLILIGFCLFGAITPLNAAALSRDLVVALPADGQLYVGEIDLAGRSPLRRDGFIRKAGRNIIYLVVAEPGESYTFGLRMPNLGLTPLNVMAFDRWPYDPAAKMQHLPTGSTLMSHQDYIEYQWHIGVSAQSPGNLLYLVVELEKPLKAAYRRFPVRAFMIHPPLDPLRVPARGVTYARGPVNLMLQERDSRVRVVEIARQEPDWRPDESWVIPSDAGLIDNGRFTRGLRSWSIFPVDPGQKELGVSVGEQGLRLWARELNRPRGVEQLIRSQQGRRGPDHLTLDLRIDHQTQRDNLQQPDDFPLRLDIECLATGEEITEVSTLLSRVFSVVQPNLEVSRKLQVVQVPLAAWYRYEIDFSDQFSAACGVKRVRLSGGGYPEREVRIKQLQLVPKSF